MRITADANILVRVIVRDDVSQAQTALGVLTNAEAVFLPLPCLCEFAWVLERTYRLSREHVAASISGIVHRENVETDIQAVRDGLAILGAGGDFADGVIASVGARMGGDAFISFDRKAIAQVRALGLPADQPSALA